MLNITTSQVVLHVKELQLEILSKRHTLCEFPLVPCCVPSIQFVFVCPCFRDGNAVRVIAQHFCFTHI